MLDGLTIGPGANVPYFQDRPQVKDEQNRQKYETKTAVNGRGVLATTYCGYIFQKAEPEYGQPKKTWARVMKNEIPISGDDLLARVRKHQRKGVSVLKQYESLTPLKRTQVDRVLEEKRRADKDPRYEWNIASLSTEERNIGRSGKETVSMQVILRRQQKKGLSLGNSDQKGLSGVIVDIHAPKKETKNQQGFPTLSGERPSHPQSQTLFGQVGNGGVPNLGGFLPQGRSQGPPPMIFDDRQDRPHDQGLFGQAGNGGIPNMGGFVPQGHPQGAHPPPPPPPPPMSFENRVPPPHHGFPGPQAPGVKLPHVMQPQMFQESQPPMFAYENDSKEGKGKTAKRDHGDHGYFSTGSGFESDRSKGAKQKNRHSKSKKSKGKGDKRTRNWASGRSDSFSESASDSDSIWDSDDNASIITPNSSQSSEARREQKRYSGDHKEHHHRGSHGRSREREREPARRHRRISPQPSPRIVFRNDYEEEPRRVRPQRYEEDYPIVEPNRSRGLLGRRMTTGYSTERPPPGRHSASYDLIDPHDRRPRYPGATYPRVTGRLQEFPHSADRYSEEDFDDVLYRDRVDRRGSYTEAPRRRVEVYTDVPRRRSDFFIDEDF